MARGAGHGYLLEQPQESHRLLLDRLLLARLRSRSPVQPGPQVGMLRTARSFTATARTRAPR